MLVSENRSQNQNAWTSMVHKLTMEGSIVLLAGLEGGCYPGWDGEKNLWEPQYLFSLRLRSLRDFVRRCRFQQISPNSHFKKGRVCTLLTRDGRVTLTDSKLIVTRKGRRVERPVNCRGEFDRLLRKWFGINLQNDSMRKG